MSKEILRYTREVLQHFAGFTLSCQVDWAWRGLPEPEAALLPRRDAWGDRASEAVVFIAREENPTAKSDGR
jgi:hypothetical protein